MLALANPLVHLPSGAHNLMLAQVTPGTRRSQVTSSVGRTAREFFGWSFLGIDPFDSPSEGTHRMRPTPMTHTDFAERPWTGTRIHIGSCQSALPQAFHSCGAWRRALNPASRQEAKKQRTRRSVVFPLTCVLTWVLGCGNTGTYEGKSTKQWIAALADTTSIIQEHAMEVLSRGEAVPELMKALNRDPSERVRSGAAAVLTCIIIGTIGESDSRDKAIAALVRAAAADGSDDVRQRALLGLDSMLRDFKFQPLLPTKVVASLVGIIDRSANWEPRARAVHFLSSLALQDRMPTPEVAIPALIRRARIDPVWQVRLVATQALGRLGPAAEDAVFSSELKSELNSDPNPGTARLISIPPPGLLVVLHSDRNPEVRAAAASAIGSIVTPRIGDRVGWLATCELGFAARDDTTVSVRLSAARAIGWIAFRGGAHYASSAVPLLCSVVKKDRDAEVRRAAAQTLGYLASSAVNSAEEESIVSSVVEILAGAVVADPDAGVRATAASELGGIGPAATSAADSLRKASLDTDYEVSDAARKALAEIVRNREP